MGKKYWVSVNKKISDLHRKILNEYLSTMKLANMAPSTITDHRSYLEKFLVEYPKPIKELTLGDVLNWLRINYRNRKEGTINRIISILSCFFRFCLEEEYINRLLIKNRWRPKMPRPIPKYLDKGELAQVRLAAEKLPLRDRTIVEFMLSSGCRVCELYGLNIADLDLTNRTARVVGKGKKIRYVHFSELCAILFSKYLDSHSEENKAVFLSRRGDRLSIRSIEDITAKLGQRANLSRRLSPHRMRHTFATNLLSKGAELDFIADELGHKQLNTTRIYAQLPSEQLVSMYRKYMG